MPVPALGFQALVLCGPGVSLTLASKPEELPKALINVANRPLVFYVLDWLKRSGVSDITLITPPSAAPPLQAALKQNQYLTSLPSPNPTVLAPKDLELVTGTAELLRLPEVQSCIKTDFLLLPCDLICEIPGENLLESWMVSQSALGGSSTREGRHAHGPISGPGGEQGGRRGGLAVYYQTQGREESVKGEATDFVAIAPLDQDEAPAVNGPRFPLDKLVMSMPMDTVKEKIEADKGFLIRHSLVEKHAQVKMLSSYRDAHLYVFPYWIKDLARHQEKFQSVSEDLIGYWAKSEWQKGLGEKLGMNQVLGDKLGGTEENGSTDGEALEEEIDLQAMSTTRSGSTVTLTPAQNDVSSPILASRVKSPSNKESEESVKVPPILAYVQRGSAPFIRRVDSSAILLSTSLRLAKLPSIEEVGRQAASPLAHSKKIAHPEGVPKRCTVTESDCLVDINVTIEEFAVIKECCIGEGAKICKGARLSKCVILPYAVVGEKAVVTGTIVGRHSKIGRDSVLKDCEVDNGYVVPDDTDAKAEKFMHFGGLDDEDDMDVSRDFDDNGSDLGF
ncbi:eukaryotic translation initiation factor subunit eIF2B-gamma [Penicillium argentinense]|uniref:Translation initiation factor eIF2B subunit gamma n=1 Tax=Penicillium argentinense TaxID=1131581 RepID=A0A9W9FH10_9EURO|nr:eukaryotic translation initiation factor subunit eIF2B-gamma [Penicillium argentinense]KAJ5100032.1 eukaryotic translation initiation factor subunit eIF2B-gamma [Penicillium argentinense]